MYIYNVFWSDILVGTVYADNYTEAQAQALIQYPVAMSQIDGYVAFYATMVYAAIGK